MTAIVSNKNLIWALFFTLLSSVFLIFEAYWIFLIPVAFFIVFSIFYHPQWAFLAVVFFMPLSINTDEFIVSPVALFIPTEPILICLMIIYFFSQQISGMFNKNIFSHPVFIAYCIYLSWILLVSVTSMDPLVSLKFFIAHCWLFFPVFIFAAQSFRDKKNVLRFAWLIISSMTIVSIFTIVHHSQYGFEEKPAHWVMAPFFKDHTSYGAILALIFPLIIGLIIIYYKNIFTKYILYGLLLIISVALILSYTRAAWISLLAAAGIWFIMYFRIKFSTLVILACTAGFLAFMSYDKIMTSLEKNDTDSSEDFSEHITSISNINTDASNVERLNRWDCALEMFRQKPLTGWGPGTYQFYYAPFQQQENMTIISTNFGDGGNAHSEYLGPLAESGLFGLLFFIVVLLVLFYRAFSNYRYIEDFELRVMYVAAVLGLCTYFIHGALNNYLDTDKAAVPVWSIAGFVAAIDIFHVSKKKNNALTNV